MRVRAAAVAVCIGIAVPVVLAAEADEHKVLEKKLEYVVRLASDPVATRRIEASGDEKAKSLLGAAAAQIATARNALQSRDILTAETALNRAIWSLGQARKLAPDPKDRLAQERQRYARLMRSAETLLGSYGRHRGRFSAAQDAELSPLAERILHARSLADAGKFGEANGILVAAEKRLLEGLSRVLNSATLDYSPKFESVAEEFEYELNRLRNLDELVPVALAELNPRADARILVGRYVEGASRLKETALDQARRKDHQGALASVRQAIGNLQQALTATGLVVPQ